MLAVAQRLELAGVQTVGKTRDLSSFRPFVVGCRFESPGRPGGYSGHKSTDARANRHQDNANRERYEKERENPRERFVREAVKPAAACAGRAAPTMDEPAQKKWDEGMEAVREFNEARATEQSRKDW
jgi:hypothetical protein